MLEPARFESHVFVGTLETAKSCETINEPARIGRVSLTLRQDVRLRWDLSLGREKCRV